MNEKKSEQLGLRIAPDVKDAYKAFCEENNCAMGEGVDLLLKLHALHEAEQSNTARGENLAAFRHHVEALVSLQVASLTLADDAKVLAREEFAVQLNQDAQLIRTLQDNAERSAKELVAAHEAKNAAEAEVKTLCDKVTALDERIAYIQAQLQDKEKRIQFLSEEVARTEGLPARYQALLEDVSMLQKENKALSDQVKDNEIAYMRTINALEKELYQLRLDGAKPQGIEAK